MNEEFVHKNVYELEKRRLEERMEHSIERNDMRTDYFMANVNAMLAEMRGDLKAMNARLTNMGWTITLAISIVGIVLAGMSIYITTLIK